MSGKQPIVLSDSVFEGEHTMLCPICRNEYVHPTSVRVVNVQGKMQVTVSNGGIFTEARPVSGRGVSIELGFWCEAGHSWVTTLTFSKGNTQVETSEDDAPVSVETIWRD